MKDNEYDRRYSSYHTSYCAAIGLVDYEFLQVRDGTGWDGEGMTVFLSLRFNVEKGSAAQCSAVVAAVLNREDIMP